MSYVSSLLSHRLHPIEEADAEEVQEASAASRAEEHKSTGGVALWQSPASILSLGVDSNNPLPSSPSPSMYTSQNNYTTPPSNNKATSVSISPAMSDDGLFNYDDEELVEEQEEPELTWRLDPSISLSDWIIKVFNKETRQPEPYYVHKNVLAVGPRKSEYFVRYFLSHENMNGRAQSTDVWLERVAAEVIPNFLDYIYSVDSSLEISTASAVGLRHVAQFFGNRVLHQKVMHFIKADLTMENVGVYYQDSVVVDDAKVSEMTSNKCSENILSIDKSNELLSHIDPAFFRRIMASDFIDSLQKQYHVSILLAEYCLLNKQHLDDQDFIRLTSDHYLPVIHFDAAIILLDCEADLVVSNEDNGVVSSLQERCIQDLSMNWEELSKMKQAEVLRVLRKLPSGVVADMLVKALTQARTKLGGAESTMQSSKAKLEAANLKKEYESKMAAMERLHQQALDNMKGEFEKNLLKLRDLALEKEQTIVELKGEMNRFERMPNQPGGRLMQSGSAQQPESMPKYGEHTAEGLVLTRPKGGGKFAIFYYDGKQ